MQQVDLIIRDVFVRANKEGRYICHIKINGKLIHKLDKNLKDCTRVQLIIDAINNSLDLIKEASCFNIITLAHWGGTVIQKEDGLWRKPTDKRVQASTNKEILLKLQDKFISNGHKLNTFKTSRNMVLDKIPLDEDLTQHSYISFKVDTDTKLKFEELCNARAVDEEKVLNKILKSFLNRNIK